MFNGRFVRIRNLAAVLAIFTAVPALANIIESGSITANCQGYSGTVIATDLQPSTTYFVDITFTRTCGGVQTTFTDDSNSFTTAPDITTADTVTVSVQGQFSGSSLNSCTVTATATLNTYYAPIDIPVTGNFNCPPTTACVLPPSGTAIGGAPVSWNGFTAPAGSVVWINAHLDAKNVPTNTITTVDLTGVSLVVNQTTYALPDGHVVFNPATTTPTTVYSGGSWTTTVNPTYSGDIFFVGQAIPVDANMMNGGHGNTGSTLSFSTNSSDSSLQFQWQWSAAVYTSWPGNSLANIEPVHANLQAGAPQNTAVQKDLIQGPRGGGGSNFTGSWSGTGKGICPQ